MDEDVIFQAQEPKDVDADKNASPADPAANVPESDSGTTNDRVFDITPDMNISPVTEENQEKADVIKVVNKAPLQNAPIKAALTPAIAVPTVNVPSKPSVQAPIPMPEVSRTSEMPEASVAAPVPKMPEASRVSEVPPTRIHPPNDLQAVISSIMPGNIPSISKTGQPAQVKIETSKTAPFQVPQAQATAPQMVPPAGTPIINPVAQAIASAGPNVKPMRTYEGDFAEAMSHNKISAVSMAIAESKKNEGVEKIKTSDAAMKPPHSTKKVVISLLSLVLIGGGMIAAYYLYSMSPLAPATAQPQAVQSLIPKESEAAISVDGTFPAAVISRVKAEIAKPQANNSIKEIVFEKTEGNGSVRLSPSQMASIMDLRAPDILLRSLTFSWMLGVYADQNGQKDVFVALTDDFFQNTFAGMLQWENTMAEDFRQYLDIPSPDRAASSTQATSTKTMSPKTTPAKIAYKQATSTQQATSTSMQESLSDIYIPPYFSLAGRFTDRIIKNKDVREFVTSSGQAMFLYSFVNNDMLVIAGNEATLAEIITRLENRSFLR
jgi:hypothetical protein